MKIAVVHHHLDRGGVTQVLVDQLVGLDALGARDAPKQVLVLHGGRAGSWPQDLPSRLANFEVTVRTVDGLDYDDLTPTPPTACELAARLVDALAAEGFQPDDTVVHVHNHAIGKSAALPGALGLLARRGYRLLLQVHDFAEDFRPRNYRWLHHGVTRHRGQLLADVLYPQAPHVHYAVLNGRDRRILTAAGISPARLHLLPNAVRAQADTADRGAARHLLHHHAGIAPHRRYLLYPVRGIRRKNLGEALLWATLFRSSAHLGVTLAPHDDIERPSYDRWRRVAAALQLPVSFEVGHVPGITLAGNFAAADHVVTTSVAEGFGFAFLEGYLAGRPVVGRDLPEITADFARDGVDLTGLHPHVRVPVTWLGLRHLVDMFDRTYNAVLGAYGRPQMSRAEIASCALSKVHGEHIDFADLDSSAQEEVLREAAHHPSRRARLLDANPWMLDACTIHGDGADDHVAHNAAQIEHAYSLAAAGQRLRAVYRRLMEASPFAPVEAPPDGAAVLDNFLRFDRFRPVLA